MICAWSTETRGIFAAREGIKLVKNSLNLVAVVYNITSVDHIGKRSGIMGF